MSRRITATIEEHIYNSLKEEASVNGLSPNKLMTHLLNSRYSNTNVQETLSDPDDNGAEGDPYTGRRNYTLNSEYASLLHRKASALGLSDSAYLRMMIRTKDFKRINYSLDDLETFISQSQELIDSVVRFVNFIGSSGKGNVYEQDIKRILSLLEEIRSLNRAQVRYTYTNRQKVYRKMIKRIEDEL